MNKTIKELEEEYDLELEKVVAEIKSLPGGVPHKGAKKAKLVLLQFPDGLKPWATAVVDFLEEKTKVQFLIWMGSCFGACDTPVLGKELEKQIDLVIQFGHNELQPSYG